MLLKIDDLKQGQEVLDPLLQQAASLASLYDKFLEEDEGDGHLRRPGIHASELGCERKVFYTLTGAKKNPRVPKKWKQRFEHGHAVHHMLQKQFHKMANHSNGLITFEHEVRIEPRYQTIAEELQLDSSCDGVFILHNQYRKPIIKVGLEIKSESPDGWDALKAPKPDHVAQAHLYMKALDIPVFWFMYFNKGNQNNTNSYHPWLVGFNEDVWQKIENKCRRLIHMVEEFPQTGKMPDKSESVVCEFCPYRGADLCNPEWMRKKMNRVFNPKTLRS